MARSWAAADSRSRYNLIALTAFLVVLLLFGGASRADELGQAVVRIAAILLIVSSSLQLDLQSWRRIRLPALFLIAIAALIAAQLIPLPEPMWRALPGREPFAAALTGAEIGSSARPLALTPDLTLNSLLALLPPLAAVLCLGLIDRRVYVWLVPILLIGIALSAALGIMQVSTGSPYLYRVTNLGSAVGAFANRNHQALFLATAFPLLAGWLSLPMLDGRSASVRLWTALCVGAVLFPMLLVTGSRGGLLFGLLGLIAALALAYHPMRLVRARPPQGRLMRLALAVPLALGAAAIVLFVFFARDVALQRMFWSEDTELRTEILPTLIRMMSDFFPVGSGFGSFDPVYRSYEPVETLSTTYVNHAHNDVVQLIIEGGLPATALMLAFAGWFVVSAVNLWRQRLVSNQQLLGRVASAALLMIMLSSLVDYPLRTPMFASVAAILCCWMLPGRQESRFTMRD